MCFNKGPSILPGNTRGTYDRPAAIANVAQLCAIIWAGSILPHFRATVNCNKVKEDMNNINQNGRARKDESEREIICMKN